MGYSVWNQEYLLQTLLRRACDTEWGKQFGFADLLQSPDPTRAFQARVPLHDYDDLLPFIERMRAGEPDVLWPGAVREYAISSGTTSNGKLLPASPDLLRAMVRCSIRMGLGYVVAKRRYEVLRGKMLTLPGRVEADPVFPGNTVGEMSGLVSRRASWWVRRFYQAAPTEALVSSDWSEKLGIIAARTATMDVRQIVAVPTWAPVLFEQLLDAARRQGRAARFVQDVWPNLRVFFSGGVALDSYRLYLERHIPEVDLVEAYSASEGFFACQRRPSDRDMLLRRDSGVFYEFVRMEDRHRPAPRRYTVSEVEPGVRYALFVTTCAGLWAYGVRDVVRFTSVFPHRIVVAGRTTEMLDGFGEAVFAEEARTAVEYASRVLHAPIQDFHVAPRASAEAHRPGHRWYVEFSGRPAEATALARLLDEHLCAINRHYQIRRAGGALSEPEVVVLSCGTFLRWMAATKTVGAQVKVPRLRDDRTIADALERLVGSEAGEAAQSS